MSSIYLYDVLLPEARAFKESKGVPEAYIQTTSRNGCHRIVFVGLAKKKQKELNTAWEKHCDHNNFRNDTSLEYK